MSEFDIDPVSIGAVVSGRYTIADKLGEGGMGVLYRATDSEVGGRTVVLKFPKKELLYRKGFRERFQREIESLVQFDHPHVVRVYGVGEYERTPFVVLQYLAGGSLESKIQQKRLVPEEVLKWLPDLAATLDSLHQRGIIHRDVKAGNILFDAYGEVYLSDFGIVKLLSEIEQGTATGGPLGSPESLAPEAMMNATPGPAYDQYGLATAVYQAMCAQLPFESTNLIELVAKIANELPKPLIALAPNVGQDFSNAVMKALSKNPQQRHRNCAEFAAALALAALRPAAASASQPSEPPENNISESRSIAQSRRITRVLGFSALVALCLGASIFLFQSHILKPENVVATAPDKASTEAEQKKETVSAAVPIAPPPEVTTPIEKDKHVVDNTRQRAREPATLANPSVVPASNPSASMGNRLAKRPLSTTGYCGELVSIATWAASRFRHTPPAIFQTDHTLGQSDISAPSKLTYGCWHKTPSSSFLMIECFLGPPQTDPQSISATTAHQQMQSVVAEVSECFGPPRQVTPENLIFPNVGHSQGQSTAASWETLIGDTVQPIILESDVLGTADVRNGYWGALIFSDPVKSKSTYPDLHHDQKNSKRF